MVRPSPSSDFLLTRSRSRSEHDLHHLDVDSAGDEGLKRSASGSRIAQLVTCVPEVTEERVGIVVSKVGSVVERCC